MWRLAPFYIALAAAPLLFGGVKPESQAVLGILLSLGLLLTAADRTSASLIPNWLKWTLLTLLILPLIPLPIAVVNLFSPERARLAQQFPIDQQIPAYLTLSTSPARTIQRLWEILLAASAFLLARHNAKCPSGPRNLAITLATALLLLAASDVWSAAHGRETILGLWDIAWGKGAATFANRSHFANWVNIASFFCIGWILRELFYRERKPTALLLAFVAAAVIIALTTAFLTASRGGALSFLVGCAVFLFALRERFQKKTFALAASLSILSVLVIAIITAEPLLARVHTNQASLSYKFEIWRETLGIVARFPIFGAGPGSFVRVFDHYKSAHGDSTFWHAENDYLELPLELGLPFATLFFALLAVFAVKLIPRRNSALNAGLLASLSAFGIHSAGEFVSYIAANLILIATLLGTAVARLEPKEIAPRPPSQIRFTLRNIAAVLFLALALLQTTAAYFFLRANRAPTPGSALKLVNTSLANWPFAVDRAVAQIRLASEDLATFPRPRQYDFAPVWTDLQNRALRLDPLNWTLRLEQTWFQLAYTTNTARALSNAWLTIRLNPRQGQIPIRFARHFAQRDPDLALQFLAAVPSGNPSDHLAALQLAWSITHDPAQLWKLTPNTTHAILNLIQFASQNNLHGTALQGCQMLEGRIPADQLARLLEPERTR